MYLLGIIPIIWLAILIAPYITNGGIINVIKNFSNIINNPLRIIWCKDSLKIIFIFIAIYILAISIYITTRKNYRRREEHGSAKWGNAKAINKKFIRQ